MNVYRRTTLFHKRQNIFEGEQIKLNVVDESVFEDDERLFAKSQSAWVFTHDLALSLSLVQKLEINCQILGVLLFSSKFLCHLSRVSVLVLELKVA